MNVFDSYLTRIKFRNCHLTDEVVEKTSIQYWTNPGLVTIYTPSDNHGTLGGLLAQLSTSKHLTIAGNTEQ